MCIFIELDNDFYYKNALGTIFAIKMKWFYYDDFYYKDKGANKNRYALKWIWWLKKLEMFSI